MKYFEETDPSINLSQSFGRLVNDESALNGLDVNKSGKLVGVKDFGDFAEQPRLARNPPVSGKNKW